MGDIPRFLAFTLSTLQRAIETDDFSALGTINEHVQPVADAVVRRIRALRADMQRLQAERDKARDDLERLTAERAALLAPVEGVDLEEVLRLDREGTAGPWRTIPMDCGDYWGVEIVGPDGRPITGETRISSMDRDVVERYRTAAPALAREVARLRADNADLLATSDAYQHMHTRAVRAEAARAQLLAEQERMSAVMRDLYVELEKAQDEGIPGAFAGYRQVTTAALGIDPASCAEDVEEAIRELRALLGAEQTRAEAYNEENREVVSALEDAGQLRAGKDPVAAVRALHAEVQRLQAERAKLEALAAELFDGVPTSPEDALTWLHQEVMKAITTPNWPGVLVEILLERGRQIEKGYTAEHDDGLTAFELSTVAAAVTLGSVDHLSGDTPEWAGHIIEKWDTRRRLVIAAALVVAEIERLDRKQGGRTT